MLGQQALAKVIGEFGATYLEAGGDVAQSLRRLGVDPLPVYQQADALQGEIASHGVRPTFVMGLVTGVELGFRLAQLEAAGEAPDE